MPTLYDQYGQPIKTSALKEEFRGITVPLIRSKTSAEEVSRFGRISPSRLSTIFKDADEGKFADMISLAEEVRKSDTHAHAVLSKLGHLVMGLIMDVPALDDSSESVEVAEFLLGLTRRPEFKKMCFILLSAVEKGFSACEILWDSSGKYFVPRDYREVDLRGLKYAPEEPVGLAIREKGHVSRPIPPWKFVIHKQPVNGERFYEGGLIRQIAPLYVGMKWMLGYWLGLGERFGMPIPVVTYPSKLPDKEKQELLEMISNISQDFSAAFTDTVKFELHSPSNVSGNMEVYRGFIELYVREVSKVVLGQTMTTEDGSSLSQAQIHKEDQDAVVSARANALCNTIVRDLFVPLVQLNFGMSMPVPELVASVRDEEDLGLLTTALTPWVDRGVRVEESVILDKFGLPQPLDGGRFVGVSQGQIQLNAASSSPAKGRPDPIDVAIRALEPELNAPDEEFVSGIIEAVEGADSSVEMEQRLEERLAKRMRKLRGVLAAGNFVGMTIGDSIDG